MKPGKRQDAIVNFVSEKGRVTVEELADSLGASRETIRRDLTILSEQDTQISWRGRLTATGC